MKMSRRCVVCVIALMALAFGVAGAQDQPAMSPEQAAMMAAWQKAMTPGPQHAMLAKMAGEFTLEVKSWMTPGAEPEVSTAHSSRRMILGGHYLEETVKGSTMGQEFEGRALTGYDNVSGTWFSTWVDSMSTGIMTSTGEWDLATGVGTFHGEYNDPMTGAVQKSRTVIHLLEGGGEKMESYMVNDSGEFKSMEIVYTPTR